MNICTGSTIFGILFYITEIMIIFILIFIYSKCIYKLFHSNLYYNYEILDLCVIILSCMQLLFTVCDKFFLFELLNTLTKFTQNGIIISLLIIISSWKHSVITDKLLNYFLFSLFIIVCVFLIFGLIEVHPLNTNECKPKIILIINILGLISNLIVDGSILFVIIKEKKDSTKDIQLINVNNGDFSENCNEEQFSLEGMFAKYANNMNIMRKSYFIMSVMYLITYIITVWFTIMKGIHSNNINTCDYYGNYNETFDIKAYIFCFLMFIIRDLSIHIYIFLVMIYFKTEHISRSSSFIEYL